MTKAPTKGKVGEVMKVEIKEGTENIPKAVYSELARCFFSEITEFYNDKKKVL